MSIIYRSPLKVKPFVTAPHAQRQQGYLLMHAAQTGKTEHFINLSHRYAKAIHGARIVCQIYEYRGHVLISTTFESAEPEVVTGRPGTSLCIGALLHPDVFAQQDVCLRTTKLYAAFFRIIYGAGIEDGDAAAIIRDVQRNPVVLDGALQSLVYSFQEEFGIVSARRMSRTRLLRLPRRLRALWLTDPLSTFSDFHSARDYWRDVDSRLAVSSPRDVNGIEHQQARPTDILVLGAPLILTELSFLQSFVLRDNPSALGRAAADVGCALIIALAVSFAHSSSTWDGYSRGAGVCGWPLARSTRPFARWVVAISVMGFLAFLIRIAWIWSG